MKRIVVLLAAALAISACSPSEAAVVAAISQTQAKWTIVPPLPTLTPRATYTPAPTYTAAPTIAIEVTRVVIVEVTQTSTPTPLYTPTDTPPPTETLPPTETPNKAQTQAAQTETVLRNPKGDGFYLIGVDIAPGTWRSQGDGTGCYWSVTDRKGKILDNDFGMAGGTAYLPASGFQVEFKGCGRWVFLSPP